MNKENAIERMRMLVEARTPFLHQGRDIDGIDCIGALAFALQYDKEIPAYPRDPVNGELEKELQRVIGSPIIEVKKYEPLTSTELLQPLDILAMQYRGPTRHVAMVVPHISIPDVLSVIHTDSILGRVTEHILDRKWIGRIVKVWRP